MAKYKKMTNKEFKEALTAAGFDFDIWGYDGILNIMSIYCGYEAQKLYNNGSDNIARHSEERGENLYNLLKERGYYNR